MINISITTSNCLMWKNLDSGTVIRMSDVQAKEAISNNWATLAGENLLLLGERVRLIKKRRRNDK